MPGFDRIPWRGSFARIALSATRGNDRFGAAVGGGGMTGMVKDIGCRPARHHPRARGRRPISAQGRTRGPRTALMGIYRFR
jgi:hypothetical protein